MESFPWFSAHCKMANENTCDRFYWGFFEGLGWSFGFLRKKNKYEWETRAPWRNSCDTQVEYGWSDNYRVNKHRIINQSCRKAWMCPQQSEKNRIFHHICMAVSQWAGNEENKYNNSMWKNVRMEVSLVCADFGDIFSHPACPFATVWAHHRRWFMYLTIMELTRAKTYDTRDKLDIRMFRMLHTQCSYIDWAKGLCTRPGQHTFHRNS